MGARAGVQTARERGRRAGLVPHHAREEPGAYLRHRLLGATLGDLGGHGNIVRPAVQELTDEVVPRRRVQIQAALGDADAARDVVHRQSDAALLQQQLSDGLEDRLPTPFPDTVPATRAGGPTLPSPPGRRHRGPPRLPPRDRRLARGDCEGTLALPRKGDLIVWHARLVHGGTPVTGEGRTRKSLVAHYLTKSVKAYYEMYYVDRRKPLTFKDLKRINREEPALVIR